MDMIIYPDLACKITAICFDVNVVVSNGFDIDLYYPDEDNLDANGPMTWINLYHNDLCQYALGQNCHNLAM